MRRFFSTVEKVCDDGGMSSLPLLCMIFVVRRRAGVDNMLVQVYCKLRCRLVIGLIMRYEGMSHHDSLSFLLFAHRANFLSPVFRHLMEMGGCRILNWQASVEDTSTKFLGKHPEKGSFHATNAHRY